MGSKYAGLWEMGYGIVYGSTGVWGRRLLSFLELSVEGIGICLRVRRPGSPQTQCNTLGSREGGVDFAKGSRPPVGTTGLGWGWVAGGCKRGKSGK